MRLIVIPTVGDARVVNSEWDALLDVLGIRPQVQIYPQPSPNGPGLLLVFGINPDRPVNHVATAFAGETLQHYRLGWRIITGPAIVLGVDKEGTPIDLEPLEIIRLGARLVRAERTALK